MVKKKEESDKASSQILEEKKQDTPTKEKEIKKDEKKEENPDQLKKKVESLVGIIEELSSNVDKNGLPEFENMMESKLKDINEKVDFKFQELKTVLDSLEKKTGKGKTKEEISVLIDEFKKSIEPRFNGIEDKMKLLDKLESIGLSIEQLNNVNGEKKADGSSSDNGQSILDAFKPRSNNYEMESVKKNVGEINETLSILKDQMKFLKDNFKAEALLDSQDIEKLERVLSSFEEMVPQRAINGQYKNLLTEIGDLKKRLEESSNLSERNIKLSTEVEKNIRLSSEDLSKRIMELERSKESYFSNLNSRLETLIKYVNTISEDIEGESDGITKIPNLDLKMTNLEKLFNQILTKELIGINQSIDSVKNRLIFLEEKLEGIENDKTDQNILNSTKELKRELEFLKNKTKVNDDIQKYLKDTLSNGSLRRLEDDLKRDTAALSVKIDKDLPAKLDNTLANKLWMKNALDHQLKEVDNFVNYKFGTFEKYLNSRQDDMEQFINEKMNKLQNHIDESIVKSVEDMKKFFEKSKASELKTEEKKQKLFTILKELRS